jgi:putative redox protein
MYKVEVSGDMDSPFKVRSSDYEFLIDTKGRGMSPPDTLLASLASCVGVYIRKYCEGAKLALDDFKITAEAELSEERPVCFRSINVSIDLKNSGLDERRKAALLEFIKNCPVHNTLKINPAVNVKLT